MSSRKGREEPSSCRGKRWREKQRKPIQSSTDGGGTERNDKSEKFSKSYDCTHEKEIRQSTSGGLDDCGLGASYMRTHPSDDTRHARGREELPISEFFNLSASTGSKESYAQILSTKTTEASFANFNKKHTALKSPKRKKNDKIESKNTGVSDCDSSGDSDSKGNIEESESSNSANDSTGDDIENSFHIKKSKHRSRTEGSSSGTSARKRTHKNNARKNGRRYKSKFATNKILLRELSELSLTPEKYEWQFFDGRWITYGQVNFAGIQPSDTTWISDDIESFYRSRFPEQRYMIIENKDNSFKLDFTEMTQTNQSTSSKRRIRRIPKKTAIASSSLELCNNNGHGSSNMHHGSGRGPRGDSPHSHGIRPTILLWQFKDASGAWRSLDHLRPK